MKTILEFSFPITDGFELSMPGDAKVLAAFVQSPNEGVGLRTACLWAEVETDAPKTRRKFAVVGTGNPVPMPARRYICTFPDGPFVWHLFETW